MSKRMLEISLDERAVEQLGRMGNALPHLPCHLKPRYYGDSAPGAPIWQDRAQHRLEPAEYEDRVAQLRTAVACQGARERGGKNP
jgi:diadenosine tetraphosphate (Ap4A) HIT family hydrolase